MLISLSLYFSASPSISISMLISIWISSLSLLDLCIYLSVCLFVYTHPSMRPSILSNPVDPSTPHMWQAWSFGVPVRTGIPKILIFIIPILWGHNTADGARSSSQSLETCVLYIYIGKTRINHPQITINRWYVYHSL